jgi:hypothetical protein
LCDIAVSNDIEQYRIALCALTVMCIDIGVSSVETLFDSHCFGFESTTPTSTQTSTASSTLNDNIDEYVHGPLFLSVCLCLSVCVCFWLPSSLPHIDVNLWFALLSSSSCAPPPPPATTLKIIHDLFGSQFSWWKW